jgi:hypothetical protein
MYVFTSLICKVVLNTLAPYHIAWFFVQFNISNISIWLDFYFDQVKQLFKNLKKLWCVTYKSYKKH